MNKYKSLIIGLLAIVSASCSDDLLYNSDELGEGEAKIAAQLSFKNFTPALDGSRAATGGTAGTALDSIDNLYVFVYNEAGTELVTKQYFKAGDQGFSVENTNNNKPAGSTGVGSDALPTSKATFDLTLPYGRYKIYAAANVPEDRFTDDKIATVDDLKAISFDWNEQNISTNDQMFGFFSDGSSTTDDPTSDNFSAPVVTVGQASQTLTGWLHRLASKVTVAFDPSGLKEAVTIYVKSVTIHDIPASCPLGESNKPTAASQLITWGQTVSYSSSDDHTTWLRLQRGSGVQGSQHAHGDDNSLFFYENNQGDFEGQGQQYNKTMDSNEMNSSTFLPDQLTPGGNPEYIDWKDKVPFGTFIEVEAYYLSQNSERPSSGSIRYRFMLGKNTTYNYNAERNHHYKLTLKFNGWANEPDWHIDYDEPDRTLYAPEHYYISYLYNQEMKLPLRLMMNNDDPSNYELRSEIIENNWAPMENLVTGKVPAQDIGAWNIITGFSWNYPTYNSSTNPYRKGQNFVGFLSMRKTTQTILFGDMGYNEESGAAEALEEYYESNNRANGAYPLTNETKLNQPVSGSNTFGTYDVTLNSDNSLTIHVPMYTRAKEMVPASDFTGNNPYEAFGRRAIVKFTLWNKTTGEQVKFLNSDKNEITELTVPIYQVKRIVNPKAIWRKYNNTDPFNVKLMHISSATGSTFETFTSEGAWRANILVDPNGLIKLTDRNGKTVTGVGSHIDGSTGTTIEFTYTPNGTTGQTSTRCGIIEVEYHDYTCKHLIFVRQGYDAPVNIAGTDWSCYSAYATTRVSNLNEPSVVTSVNVAVTKSPLSIGSFFKRCNYNYAILEKNEADYGWMDIVQDKDLKIAYLNSSNQIVTSTAKWSGFGGFAWTAYSSSASRFESKWAENWTVKNNSLVTRTLTVPTYEQLTALRDNSEFGYGVIYADGATETATSTTVAYGYTDYDNTGATSANGIRGCIVYDPTNGNQILFPVGKVGQGRRAVSTYGYTAVNHFGSSTRDESYIGTLSYSGMRSVLSHTTDMLRPITYNLYRSPGAVYWFMQPAYRPVTNTSTTDEQRRAASWDINYFTLLFNSYDGTSLGSYDSANNKSINYNKSTDALPIRLIYK